MLYWKDKSQDNICNTCNTSRCKKVASTQIDDGILGSLIERTYLQMLHHFSIKIEVTKIVHALKIRYLIQWHEEGRLNDTLLRHPANSKTRERLDEVHFRFKAEARNVRWGLASVIFNLS